MRIRALSFGGSCKLVIVILPEGTCVVGWVGESKSCLNFTVRTVFCQACILQDSLVVVWRIDLKQEVMVGVCYSDPN